MNRIQQKLFLVWYKVNQGHKVNKVRIAYQVSLSCEG